MSENTLSFREKLVKFGTWIFLVFLFLIIVISFGMPDFIGTSSRMSSYNAAKVGGEYLTKAEVGEYQKRIEERMMQNMKGADEKTRKLYEDLAKGRALDEAIDRKIFSQILAKAGYTPSTSSEAKILAAFYKRQFAEYIVNGKLDTERLAEFLGQRKLTLDQVGRSVLQDYGPQKAFEMLQATSFASDFAVFDDMRFNETQVSYSIVAIDSQSKEKYLRGRFSPAPGEIDAKFKTEFLSKDPKAVLDAAKRETITATLFNEKRAQIEKDFASALATASKQGLPAVATLMGTKVSMVQNVELNGNIDAKKGKENAAISFAALNASDVFLKERLSAPLGQVVGPVDVGGFTYFFAITKRQMADIPPASLYAKLGSDDAKAKGLAASATFQRDFDTLSKTNYGSLLTAALEVQRHSIRIIRYNKEEAQKEK